MDLFVHTLLNLFIIFLCAGGLYLALFYYKKSIKRAGKNLELIEALRIDSKNMLCLVRFRNKEILLAVSPGATQLLSIEPEDNGGEKK
jgi:hypothetical protein